MKLFLFIILCAEIFLQLHVSARYSQYYHPKPITDEGPQFGTFQFITPQPLTSEHFQRLEETHHLLNMSAELLKDLHVKSVHSYHIQQTYSKNERYKVGIIVAGVTDKFNHMVKLFKYYARPEIYEIPMNNRSQFSHATNVIVQAYQVMQGQYNEIRLENDLFVDLLNKVKRKVVTSPEDDRLSAIAAAGSVSIAGAADMESNTMKVEDFSELTEEEKKQKAEEFAQQQGLEMDPQAMQKRQWRRLMAPGTMYSNIKFTVDTAQEEYKRSLRYKKWAEKWNGFDPKVEGIEVSNPLENMGRNQSFFLGVNAF